MFKDFKSIALSVLASLITLVLVSFVNFYFDNQWFSILETIFIFLFVFFFFWLLVLNQKIKKGLIKQKDNEFVEFKKKFENDYKPSIRKSIDDLDQKLRDLMTDLSQKYDEVVKYQNVDPTDPEVWFILSSLAVKRTGIPRIELFRSFRNYFRIKVEDKARIAFEVKINFLELNGLIEPGHDGVNHFITGPGLEVVRIARIKKQKEQD